jgi:hypothetical protein
LLAGCGGGGGSRSSSQQPAPPAPVNQAPVVTIETPATGNSFAEGEEVRLEGSAVDPEDGQLAGSGLVWTLTTGESLGTGASLVLSTLALGNRTILLTATDSDGAQGSASVSIRITEPPAPPTARAGERNPYAGRLQRTAVKRDDELVLIGRASAADQLVYGIVDRPVARYNLEPSTMPTPRITARRNAVAPVAGAAGRLLESNLHQAAVVTRTTLGSTQFRLEIVGLSDPGEDHVATLAFTPPLPAGPIEVSVADFDAFDEVSGARARIAPADAESEYHDEVALAYLEPVGSELRARVRVLSFEDVEDPELREGPVPGPTAEISTLTTAAMFPGSHFVIEVGEELWGDKPGPHLVIAYLNTARQVVADIYEYRRTRADPDSPDPRTDSRTLVHITHLVLTGALSNAAANGGGWDVVVAQGKHLGMSDSFNGFGYILVASNENGLLRQDVWKLEDLDGADNPMLMGTSVDEFARVSNGTDVDFPLTILPNSRLRAVLGRIVDANPTDPDIGRCEASGLLVLADTNRGPAVQEMSVFVTGNADGFQTRFRPMTEDPAWPGFTAVLARPETTQLTNTILVAGGLVSERNGLIDYRLTPPSGIDQFARDCAGVIDQTLLGQMPSFYVAEPELRQLSAVTIPPGITGSGSYITTAMDASVDQVPILVAADANGDAAYYEATHCIRGPTSSQCRRLFVGDADLHYSLENVETQNVVLQQPPKHVDYLRGLGGIVDVSMRDDFFAEFAQTTSLDGSINRKLKTDWSLGARVGIGLGPPVPKGGDEEFGSLANLSIEAEHKNTQEQFQQTQATVSLTQTTGAVDDDVVWSKVQTTDFWRFPAQGGRPDRRPRDATAFPDDAYLEIAIPGEPVTSIGPGSLTDAYQPSHQVGNILTYPTIDGAVQDIGELFNYLGSYVPMDAAGARQCKPVSASDPNGCVIQLPGPQGILQQVSQVLAGDDFVGGEFSNLTNPVDIAEVLQVGGISYQAELEFDTNVQVGQTVTNNDSIKASLDGKLPLHAKGVELSGELKAEASFENSKISENSLGSKTRIALHVPANIPIQRSYRVRPSFGFTPSGSLQVSYQVSTEGSAATFWEQQYVAPDPALNLPYRIVRGADDFELNSDFSHNRMKGFFVRDGAGIDPARPGESVGPMLTAAPSAGDAVQLEVRVFNLSVANAVVNLTVEFAAQAYENGVGVGPLVPIGESTIDFLPHRGQFRDAPNGHIASAFVIWDTTTFGPTSGEALKDYLVYVTLDPANRIGNETHELNDRFNDPLKGPLDVVVDPGLEKGQNNRGWSLVRIAPSATLASASASKAGNRAASFKNRPAEPLRLSLEARGKSDMAPRRLSAKAHQELRMSIGLHSERLSRDHGILQLFDGDPALGAQLIAAKHVQGLAGGEVTLEHLEWRPEETGDRVLFVRYLGAGATGALQIPVRVEP